MQVCMNVLDCQKKILFPFGWQSNFSFIVSKNKSGSKIQW